MRALIISVALFVSVFVCTAFLVVFAGAGSSTAVLFSFALGLFMVAALFAAVAAIGPKFRPTPLLTPTMGGTTAAVFTTMIIVAVTAQVEQGESTAMTGSEPPKITDRETEAAVAPAKPATIAVPAEALLPPPTPSVPQPEIPPARVVEPENPTPTEAPPPIDSPLLADIEAAISATPSTAESDVDPIQPLAPDVAPPATPAANNTVASTNPASTPQIPLPQILPPELTAPLVLSEDIFDTSPPPILSTAPSKTNPPLPRSRPCGGGAPPCP